MKKFEGNKRSLKNKFWINGSFQIRYTLAVLILTTLITGVFGYLYYQNEVAKTKILAIQSTEIAQLLSVGDSQVIKYLMAYMVLQGVVILLAGLYFTQRVAGPVTRLRDYFDDLAEGGDPIPLGGIRAGDEFKDLYQAVHRFNNRLIERKATLDRIYSMAGNIEDGSERTQEILAELKKV